ncbi:MAG: exopolyphosphatase [Corynebacterium camporealensis]|uniref:exopolyphosphatase n=1 Tax=Corynebacterium camporealensis TaxID=161896 RepID=UPI002A917FE4|nr:exopolyphosphatase [Corynebacterium camporealensis]MDY5839840.1 exopolyphosphatase [Corynebacterium camporealensis]
MDDDYFSGSDYDPETVRFFDIAHEGAQVRLLAEAVPEWARQLSGLQPRSLILLPTGPIARIAAHAAIALAEPLRLPVVVTESLPQYVGALDIVVVLGEAGECEWASHSLINADRRGAHTILIGPPRGPLLDDAPDDVLVAPHLPTAEGSSPARFFAGLAMVIGLLERDPEYVRELLNDAAAAVDEELTRLSPEHDAATNPGRQLREFVDGAQVVHSHGVDTRAQGDVQRRIPIDAMVARCAAAIWAAQGLGGTYTAPEDLPRVQAMNQATKSQSDDIFFDPFLDASPDDKPLVPLKVVLWGQEETTLPNTMAVASADPNLGELARALQLVTRAYAATAYDIA